MFLINNDLIWVPIPKCASFSIETAFVRSNLELKNWNMANKRKEFLFQMHQHPTKKNLESTFGKKETFCVKRDWFDRWVASLRFFWQSSIDNGMTPIIKYEEIDNNFIYDIFDKKFADTLNFKEGGLIECTNLLVKENVFNIKDSIKKGLSHLFLSQNYYTSNEKCTYEFDIKKLYELENFVENKFNTKIEITKNNVSNKTIQNKMIIDDKLKNYIWELFEAPYTNNKKNII